MPWDPSKPIYELPPDIASYFRIEAIILERELREQYLEVVLKDAPNPKHVGHKVRTVANENPSWYIALCKVYATKFYRKPKKYDSKVRRRFVFNALEKIIDGKDKHSNGNKGICYEYEMRQIIFDRLKENEEIVSDYFSGNEFSDDVPF